MKTKRIKVMNMPSNEIRLYTYIQYIFSYTIHYTLHIYRIVCRISFWGPGNLLITFLFWLVAQYNTITSPTIPPPFQREIPATLPCIMNSVYLQHKYVENRLCKNMEIFSTMITLL